MESFAEKGYTIKGIFGDVTLENWPAWIWWENNKQTSGHQYAYRNLTDSLVTEGKVMHSESPLKVEGRKITLLMPPGVTEGRLWLAFEGRTPTATRVHVNVWSDTTLLAEKDIELPPYGQPGWPSLYTFGTNVPFQGSDSAQTVRLEFLPTGADTAVKINNPIVEYSTYKP